MQTFTHVSGANIRVASDLGELTLEAYILWSKAEEEVLKIDGQLEELATLVEIEEVSEDAGEIQAAEYNLAKYDYIREQVSLLTHAEDRGKLKDLKRIDLYELKLLASMEYTEYEPGTTLIIPGANEAQIADLRAYLEKDVPKEDKTENARVRLQIDRLNASEFIFLPVQEAIFAAKAKTDAVRKQLPKLEEEVLKHMDGQKDETIRTNLAKYIAKVEADLQAKHLDKTQDEARELLKLQRKIREWQNSTETAVYVLADQFITHFLIPVDEPYVMKYAEARREFILKLPMSEVLPLINFILAVLRT